ncbi:HAD family hydrolase [Amycolatopsis keratiniphila]|uniref:HAD family hydrolase n=1 Tax=Amycolatopsis keratiniphila TaxID=129921 RepID=UPI0009078E46|nr:HAD family hydrolase [Amycolatopsis keratiniphila]OLZ50155.1 hypothetical protein BS330_29225 [Amycolatopsis keratiniphila subsp. nogabecina]
MAELEEAGYTVAVFIDGNPAGILELSDRLRPGAASTIRRLTDLTGTEPALLTGDNRRAATRLAAEV